MGARTRRPTPQQARIPASGRDHRPLVPRCRTWAGLFASPAGRGRAGEAGVTRAGQSRTWKPLSSSHPFTTPPKAPATPSGCAWSPSNRPLKVLSQNLLPEGLTQSNRNMASLVNYSVEWKMCGRSLRPGWGLVSVRAVISTLRMAIAAGINDGPECARSSRPCRGSRPQPAQPIR